MSKGNVGYDRREGRETMYLSQGARDVHKNLLKVISISERGLRKELMKMSWTRSIDEDVFRDGLMKRRHSTFIKYC